MKYDPIQIMFDEHDVIMKTEKIINDLHGYWDTDAAGYSDMVNELLTFFVEYSDGYHHQKEEQVLFPAITDHPDFKLFEIIDEFNNHHEGFRQYTTDIREFLESEEYANSYEALRSYSSELADHMAAENDELFVLAQNLLSENEQEKLYFLFQDIDRQLGIERKAELEQIPESILENLNAKVR